MQLDIPHLDGTVTRVRDWTIRVVVLRDPTSYCGVGYGVRVTHDGGGELIPGWALIFMDLEQAQRAAEREASWLRNN